MSRLEERVPALANPALKIKLATDVIADVADETGRISLPNLVGAVTTKITDMPVNEQLLVTEGRKAAAQQIVTAWTNSRVIKLDRDARLPSYQMKLGFEEHYLKVGSELVPVDAVTVQDMETLLERQAKRVADAETDLSIWREFYTQAKPGLERGEGLIAQFTAGTISLVASDAPAQIEEEAA